MSRPRRTPQAEVALCHHQVLDIVEALLALDFEQLGEASPQTRYVDLRAWLMREAVGLEAVEPDAALAARLAYRWGLTVRRASSQRLPAAPPEVLAMVREARAHDVAHPADLKSVPLAWRRA